MAAGFHVEALRSAMPVLTSESKLWVAYSGGLDSHVLLHALAELRRRLGFTLQAIYVNHGLSPNAASWGAHCQSICDALGVALTIVQVDARPQAGESPEAAARNARYAEFKARLATDEVLCTAHHQDDQAETLLLQLLRGAGPKGLAAMAPQSTLGAGMQVRPLLGFSQQQLNDYAVEHGLGWIEDESNHDTGFSRNYLRHEVMPLLQQRWPAMAATISRSAAHCGEAAELLEALAVEDWQQVRAGSDDQLEINELIQLSLARQKNLLRYWVHQAGLPLPSEKKLQHIFSDVIPAAGDAQPCVGWPGAEVRRFEGRLYLMASLPPVVRGSVFGWPDLAQPLELGGGQQLVAREGEGVLALDANVMRQLPVEVRFRSGGERLQLPGQAHHVELKKLLQQLRVVPWLRDRIPLLYIGEQLAGVVGYCIDQRFAAQDGRGILIEQS